nr:VOC family protein [Caulobacter hibisci]
MSLIAPASTTAIGGRKLTAFGRGTCLVIKKLNYVGIPTRDQERALAFWTGVMGFIITTDRPVGDRRWIELSIPGAQTGILLFTPDGHEDRVGTFFNGSFGCDSVQYEYERLLEKGVTFLGPPELKPFPHVYFQDPDRNTFFLSSR